MTIRFKRKRLKYNLILGILWLVLGISGVILDTTNFFVYGYLLVGILQLGTYFYENKNQYLTIENGVISKNNLIAKKINLNDIVGFKKFAGDYILKTDSSELKINTEFIDENSLKELNTFLESLNLETT